MPHVYKDLLFADYLRQIPPDAIHRCIADKDAGKRSIISASVYADLGRRLCESASVVERFKKLPAALQKTCAIAYLCGRRGAPVQTPLRGFADELLGSLLVFATHHRDGSIIVRGFNEFIETLTPLFSEVLRSAAPSAAATVATNTETGPWLSQNDLVVTCMAAERNLLKRNKDGELFKSAIQTLAKLLHTAHGHFKPHTEELVRMLVAFALHKKMIYADEQQYFLNRSGLLAHLAAGTYTRQQELEAFARDFNQGWNWPLIIGIALAAGRRGLSSSVFGTGLADEAAQVCATMHYLGLIDLAPDNAKSPFGTIRAVLSPPPAESVAAAPRLLPDFSVIIPQEIDTATLYSFGGIGVLHTLDKVYKGTVTRESVADAIAAGGATPHLIDQTLAHWQAPPNVRATVKEWVAQFSRLSLYSGETLMCADAPTAAALNAFDALKDKIELLGTHTVFKIRTGEEAAVARQLQSLGFDCRIPGGAGTTPETATDALDDLCDTVHVPSPVTEFGGTALAPQITPRAGKYGAELKALDLSELYHVMDYAIITGSQIRFEYLGSAGLKKGLHTIVPLVLTRGSEPVLDGQVPGGSGRRRYYIAKIVKIGVL